MTTTSSTNTTATTTTLPSVFTYTSSTAGTLTSSGVGSGLDINGLVSKLMQVESLPLTQLANRYTSAQTQLTAEGTVKSAVAAFQSSVQALSNTAQYNSLKATAADASILSATTSSIAKPGSYSIEVTSLAQSQKLVATGVSDASAAVGNGTLTIDVGSFDGSTFTANPSKHASITIGSGNNSLMGIRDAINAAGAGVTASIVNDGSNYRLVVTSTDTGTANTIRIGVSGDAALSNLLAYDPAGTKNMTETVVAKDAALKIDNIPVTKSSNSISDAIPGVTLNLLKMSATNTPTTLSVAVDNSGLQSALQDMVSAYNDLNQTIADVGNYDPTTKIAGPLFGDSTLRSIRSSIQSLLQTHVATGNASIGTLSDLGVSFQVDGSLKLDSTALQNALNSSSGSVISLLGKSGVPGQLNTKLLDMLSSNGSIANATNAISNLMQSYQDRAQALQTRLSKIESTYRAQFNALDQAMASMQQTSTYLTQQLSALSSSSSTSSKSG